MRFGAGDGSRTPQMMQAERELDGRIDYAYSQAREVQAKVEEVEQKLAKDAEPPTKHEVEQFKAYVLSHARTPEWEVVFERINRGELTWRQIVVNVSEARFDHELSAAMRSLSRVPPANMEELTSSGVLPDLNAAQEESSDADTERSEEATDQRTGGRTTARSRDRDDDDDEWFENQSILR